MTQTWPSLQRGRWHQMAVSLGWGQGAHWVQVTGPEAQEFPAVGPSSAVQLALQPVVLTPLPQTVRPTQLWGGVGRHRDTNTAPQMVTPEPGWVEGGTPQNSASYGDRAVAGPQDPRSRSHRDMQTCLPGQLSSAQWGLGSSPTNMKWETPPTLLPRAPRGWLYRPVPSGPGRLCALAPI